MLKFLIILFLVTYVLIKVGGFFFRAGVASQGRSQQQRKPADGNVNVDSAPKKQKKAGNIKGGDYIDYEEVK